MEMSDFLYRHDKLRTNRADYSKSPMTLYKINFEVSFFVGKGFLKYLLVNVKHRLYWCEVKVEAEAPFC